MCHTKPSNHLALRAISALLVCLWFPFPARSDVYKDRKAAAKDLGKQIEKAQFRKVYVADFLDDAGVRTERGCFYASTFSTDLAKSAHKFGVVNRIQAQKQLNDLHISPQDLKQPEMLSKVALALGADVVLVGTATISPADARLFLYLREAASGKEVHSMNYHEQLQPAFESSFPAVEDAGSHVYYYPGLDGVSLPKCIHCPEPPYSDEMRSRRIDGTVLISVRIDEKGGITDIRLIRTPHQDLAEPSINILKKWRMKPSLDSEGNAVPVRISVEIKFHLLN